MANPLLRVSLARSKRFFSSSNIVAKEFNQPIHQNDLHRASGIASFMRLPMQTDAQGLDACFIGVALDIGTTNRSGARFGPRQIRTESVLLRMMNSATQVQPFKHVQVADIGDVAFNAYNLPDACNDIYRQYQKIISTGCVPLTMGGDHTITYPILKAIKDRHGPVSLVHIDAHSDTTDTQMGAKITHGTPFRRAVEENLIDPKMTFQIGIRGSSYGPEDMNWPEQQGFQIIRIEECWHKSLTPLMSKIRQTLGRKPVYLSFDIDSIDPGFCPGTGTPEIGGLTVIQALEIVRGCYGLNLVGCDLVEVCPPYDFQGTTALTGANLLFEMLCALPSVHRGG